MCHTPSNALRQGSAHSWLTRAACIASSASSAPEAAPLRVAVVGSGPAGFYCTDRICKLLGERVRIDIYEKLPTPFGLVRSGVAPDHPDTKNVVNKFISIAERPQVQWLGNAHVGTAIPLPELRKLYSAVVLAHGSPADKQLGMPGETARGCFAAREFVNWYNGHPQCAQLPVDLCTTERVAIVGLGNVALDCARILLKPAAALAHTDIADHALAQLAQSAVREVHIIGRRGPVQTQFSGKELREVLSLANVSVAMRPEAYAPTQADLEEPRKCQKAYNLIKDAHGKSAIAPPQRSLTFHFLQSPKEAMCSSSSGSLRALQLATNTLHTRKDGSQAAQETGYTSELPVDMLLKSIGYRAVAMPGCPFDEAQGVIPNSLGRVLQSAQPGAGPEPGLYTCGWVKRGPTGIIGTNIMDAEQTAGCIAEDAAAGKLAPAHAAHAHAHITDHITQMQKENGLPQPQVLAWQDWLCVDEHEKEAGFESGRPRKKLCTITEMLDASQQSVAPAA